ncbi:hypothetical protein RKD35_002909 [Streptomyces albogriseolus]
MLDVYLVLFGVVETVPVWGPLLFVGTVAVLVGQWRSARRAAPGHVPGAVRTCADADPDTTPDTEPSSAVTCADTRPDVSVDTRADASGHEARGEQ